MTTGFEGDFILRCKFTGRPAKNVKKQKYDHYDQNSPFSGSQNVKHAPAKDPKAWGSEKKHFGEFCESQSFSSNFDEVDPVGVCNEYRTLLKKIRSYNYRDFRLIVRRRQSVRPSTSPLIYGNNAYIRIVIDADNVLKQ